MGNFNKVISSNEIYSISPPSFALQAITELQDCLTTSDLLDLSRRGCFFTWTNRNPDNLIARKLDRALINESLMKIFPSSAAGFDAPGTSDHSPCLVSLSI